MNGYPNRFRSLFLKRPIGTCINNPFKSLERLEEVINKAKRISKKVFFYHCAVPELIALDMKQYPNDFEFYKNGEVYFYKWSAIEHFYR
jgi:hypothetical protein